MSSYGGTRELAQLVALNANRPCGNTLGERVTPIQMPNGRCCATVKEVSVFTKVIIDPSGLEAYRSVGVGTFVRGNVIVSTLASTVEPLINQPQISKKGDCSRSVYF